MASRKDLPALPPSKIFSCFMLSISSHTLFLIQFEINLHLWVFQKVKIALAEAAHTLSAFQKTHSCNLFQTGLETVQLPIPVN